MENNEPFFSFNPEKHIKNPTLFESFCLLFCKKHYSRDEITGTILVAKFFRKKIYIIEEITPAKEEMK